MPIIVKVSVPRRPQRCPLDKGLDPSGRSDDSLGRSVGAPASLPKLELLTVTLGNDHILDAHHIKCDGGHSSRGLYTSVMLIPAR